MYLDLISQDCFIFVNRKIVRLFGLETATYLAELINIAKKAIDKNKLDDNGFFKVDRAYVLKQTTISIEEQLKIDTKLSKISLLKINTDNHDLLYLDIKLLCALTTEDDVDLLQDITKKVKTKLNKESRESKRKQVIASLKEHLGYLEQNFDILVVLRDWVDGVYAKPQGYLSSKLIDIFVNNVKKYAKDDKEKLIKVIEIATVHGWRDADWAIAAYEKDNSITQRIARPTQVRVTTQNRATAADIGNKSY